MQCPCCRRSRSPPCCSAAPRIRGRRGRSANRCGVGFRTPRFSRSMAPAIWRRSSGPRRSPWRCVNGWPKSRTMEGAMKLTVHRGLCAVILGVAWQGAALAGDTLFLHGHIYTGNPQAPWAAALAVSGARIEAVGTDADVLRHRGGKSRVIDLRGRTVIPGIVDSHTHLLYGAYALHGLNLSTPESSITPEKADLLVERLKAYAAAHPHDAVLFGRADFSTVPPTTPTRALLDRAVADRPVVIHNTSEHALWLNSAALTLAGITDRPVADGDEERGVIRDASGRPSGVLLEAAMQLAARAGAPRLPLEERLAMIQTATR